MQENDNVYNCVFLFVRENIVAFTGVTFRKWQVGRDTQKAGPLASNISGGNDVHPGSAAYGV